MKPINNTSANQQPSTSHREERKTEELFEEANQKVSKANQALVEAEKKTEQMLLEANEEITQLKNKWQEEKQQLIEQTKSQAYQAGFEEGKNAAFQEYEQLIAQARTIVKQANEDYEKIVEESDTTILELGIKAAEKIVNKKLKDEPEYFLSIVQSLLNEVKELEQVSVYVHPDQYEMVLEQKQELQLIMDHQANLSIYPKNTLKPFQCFVESSFGRVDASIDSQLGELRSKLSNLLEEVNSIEGPSSD